MSLRETIIPTMNLSQSAGRAITRSWIINKNPSNTSVIKPGNIVFISSYAATTVDVFDRNPVILILNVSQTYVLAFNINWLDRKQRQQMIRAFQRAQQAIKNKRMSRLQRYALFLKIRKMPFPRAAYRVYFRSQIKRVKIYNLTMGEFFEACTHNLLHPN